MSTFRWVLVVEDEDDFRDIITECLTGQGFKVISAAKLSDAKIKVKNQKFEIIFLDMHLGNDNGEEIIDLVREDQHGFNNKTPIIVMSGFLDLELIGRIGNTVNDILVKPFNLTTFTERSNAVLSSPLKTLTERKRKN